MKHVEKFIGGKIVLIRETEIIIHVNKLEIEEILEKVRKWQEENPYAKFHIEVDW